MCSSRECDLLHVRGLAQARLLRTLHMGLRARASHPKVMFITNQRKRRDVAQVKT